MKIAATIKDDEILASADAPSKAFCPLCKHPVTLRKRRLMNNRGYVYYWSHTPGGSLSCRARSSSIIRNGGSY